MHDETTGSTVNKLIADAYAIGVVEGKRMAQETVREALGIWRFTHHHRRHDMNRNEYIALLTKRGEETLAEIGALRDRAPRAADLTHNVVNLDFERFKRIDWKAASRSLARER